MDLFLNIKYHPNLPKDTKLQVVIPGDSLKILTHPNVRWPIGKHSIPSSIATATENVKMCT